MEKESTNNIFNDIPISYLFIKIFKFNIFSY